MSELVSGRTILAGAVGAALLGGAAYYVLAVLPVKTQAHDLYVKLDGLKRDRDRAVGTLHNLQAQQGRLQQEIDKLRLFDLRHEASFDSALANRSNVGLIALSEILQRNSITIDSLEPGPIDQKKIMVHDLPQGGVLHRTYLIRAQGYYQDVKEAFIALKSLPPALEIDHYDIIYTGAEANQAKVAFELGLSFNFLVSNEQLDRFADLASASMSVSKDDADSSLGDSVKGKMIPAFSLPELDNGKTSPASDSQHSSLWWSRMMAWVMPSAWAAPARPPRHAPVVAARTSASTVPVVSQPGMVPSVGASVSANSYSFSVGKKVTLGRAEPFLPLTSVLAPTVVKPIGIKVGGPLTNVWLTAVLVSGDGPASALLQFGTERLRVHPGTILSGGAQVAAIGRDFILIRDQGVLHRVGLRSESSSVSAGSAEAPSQESAPPTVPVPEIPGMPQAPGF